MCRKLLIIHMDDIGMSYASNQAAQNLFEKGIVSSASLLVPGSWAHDFVKWHLNQRDESGRIKYDLGMHITHNCEWPYARWRPILSNDQAPMLYDEEGFMHNSISGSLKSVNCKMLTDEIRAQMRLLKLWNSEISHIDNHMWFMASRDDSFKAYLDFAAEMGLIAHIPEWSLWNEQRVKWAQESAYPVLRQLVWDGRGKSIEEKRSILKKAVAKMEDGKYILTLHPVVDSPEIKCIISDWEDRFHEYIIFMEDDTAKIFSEYGVEIIDFSLLRVKFFKKWKENLSFNR